MRFYIERLGCPKNDTDAEGMSQLLVDAGYTPALDADQADVIIVNTCGFIDAAKDESRQYLQYFAGAKRRKPRPEGAGSRRERIIIAAGCFGERYGAKLAAEMPELDGIIGTRRWSEIPDLLNEILRGERPLRIGQGRSVVSIPRTAGTPSAYVKIADGCSVGCAFCAIPKIKGPHVSKPAEDVVAEVRRLGELGVREAILIAQNTGAYGHDRGRPDGLALLLERIVDEVPDIPWIRLMYTYPEHITDRLVETVAAHPRIVKYLDIPLQHAHPDALRRMKRPFADARPLIAKLRESIPQVALRSAFIVGYPGETEGEFEALLSFLEESELDRVGIFQYSAEEGTLAASLPDQVSPRIKRRRYDRAMKKLRDLSARKTRTLLGSVQEVLIEGAMEPDRAEATGQRRPRGGEDASGDITFLSVGRTYRDAPEVDGLVFLKQRAPVGTLVQARIIGAGDYDLFGELV